MTLVIKMRAGTELRINGAIVRFREEARVDIVNHVRFMHGAQIMLDEHADRGWRHQLYLAIQKLYVGHDNHYAERTAAFDALAVVLEALSADQFDELARAGVADPLERCEYHKALVALRKLLAAETQEGREHGQVGGWLTRTSPGCKAARRCGWSRSFGTRSTGCASGKDLPSAGWYATWTDGRPWPAGARARCGSRWFDICAISPKGDSRRRGARRSCRKRRRHRSRWPGMGRSR